MIGGGGEGVWKGGGADLLLIWNILEYLAPPLHPPYTGAPNGTWGRGGGVLLRALREFGQLYF